MKKHIITIAGVPGSGKSSTAKAIASELGYQHFSSGDLFRQIAAENGWSIEEINLQAEKQSDIDHQVDEKLKSFNNETDLVIDSRLAYNWIPNSYKIYLDLDPEIAAERIFKAVKSEGRASQSAESSREVYEKTIIRYNSENKRYKNLYNLDPSNQTQYDLVINTGDYSIEEVVNKILDSYQTWLKD